MNTMSKVLIHPLTRNVAVPVLVLLTGISMFVIPSVSDTTFQLIDVDHDGFVSSVEFHRGWSAIPAHPVLYGQGATTSQQFFAKWPLTNDRQFYANLTKAEFAVWYDGTNLASSALFPHHVWREAEYWLADALWWLILGILSSVGLGSGMHSGVLFLFPYIFRACAAANECGHINFFSYPVNIFFGPSNRAFQCVPETGAPVEAVAIFSRLLMVLPACLIWGAGTAMGEIPPYALAFAAASEGRTAEELEETSSWDILNRMKDWTLDKIQKYGFWAILLLAAWPNMAFDLCGMACGQFRMPFWTFFGATFIGKALIKVVGQAVFFIYLFSGDNIQQLLRSLSSAYGSVFTLVGLPELTPVVEKMIGILNDLQAKTALRARGGDAAGAGGVENSNSNLIASAMSWLVILAVAMFAKSIVDTFAQSQQETLDEEWLHSLQMTLKGKHLSNSNSNEEQNHFVSACLSVRDSKEQEGGSVGKLQSVLDAGCVLFGVTFLAVSLVINSDAMRSVGLLTLLQSLTWSQINKFIDYSHPQAVLLPLLRVIVFFLITKQFTYPMNLL